MLRIDRRLLQNVDWLLLVTAFLSGRLGFLGIAETIGRVLERQAAGSVNSLADVLAADASARTLAESMLVRVARAGT